MLTEAVKKVLSQEQEPEELKTFRTRLQGLVKMSRDTMSKQYPIWDRNDQVYRGERVQDNDDKKAGQRNEPGKVFVPLTHTQVQTFVSFGTMLMTQRDYFYELSGTGIEDEKSAKLAQAMLQRDLEHNKFQGVLLPQFLTDIARFGLGIIKSQWRRETCPYRTQIIDPKFRPNPNLPAPVQPPLVDAWEEKTKYLGNFIEVTSPYRWFPDTRLPLTRYRDGEFCADENDVSIMELRKLEKLDDVAGLQYIPKLPDDSFQDRRFVSITEGTNSRWDPTLDPKDSSHFVLITEVEVRLNPSQTFIDDGVALDETCDHDMVYIVWIANDGRIIRINDAGYDHNEFLYDASQFFNDQNRFCNFGIAELLGPMQDILDWLMNSRVTNVRKTVQNFLVVDPKNINMQDLKDRNPVIRLSSTVPDGMAIDQFIKQLQITDATSGHINDMGVIKSFSEQATGITDNIAGQYNEGRRSAREVSNVNANGAGRLITPIKGIWESAILPLGRKLNSNHRQGLDEEQLVRVIGLQRFMEQQDAVQAFVPVDKSTLVGSYDFLVFEGTLPSVRMAIANAIQQAGDVLMKNPSAIFFLNKDPQLLFDEWLELQGVRNAERFRLTPERLNQIMQMAGLVRNAGGAGAPAGQGGGNPPGR